MCVGQCPKFIAPRTDLKPRQISVLDEDQHLADALSTRAEQLRLSHHPRAREGRRRSNSTRAETEVRRTAAARAAHLHPEMPRLQTEFEPRVPHHAQHDVQHVGNVGRHGFCHEYTLFDLNGCQTVTFSGSQRPVSLPGDRPRTDDVRTDLITTCHRTPHTEAPRSRHRPRGVFGPPVHPVVADAGRVASLFSTEPCAVMPGPVRRAAGIRRSCSSTPCGTPWPRL